MSRRRKVADAYCLIRRSVRAVLRVGHRLTERMWDIEGREADKRGGHWREEN